MHTYKLVIMGESGVGKTSFALRLVKNEFYDNVESTIGGAFFTYCIDHNNTKYKFEIWDTAGQEKYRSLAPMYYRGAKVALIFYSITSAKSFDIAVEWINELKRYSNNTIIIVIGNKSDLSHLRQVNYETALETITSKMDNIKFYESSVKENKNIKDIFINLVKLLPEKNEHSGLSEIIMLNREVKENKKISYCC